MNTFKKGDKVGKFTVNDFIKKGSIAESYSAYGPDDILYFLKIFDMEAIPTSMLFEGKEVYEIQLCQELQHDNVISFVDKGGLKKGEKNYHYLVTEFYRGELLVESVKRDGVFGPEDAAQITLCVLNGLSYIHSRALIHNDIRPSNIMLQETDDGMLLPTIIDLGHISYMVMGRPTFYVEDLMPFFRAPETFKGIYTPKSDLFSTGALLYYLMFGKAPWEQDLSQCKDDKTLIKEIVKQARKQELVLETEEVKLPDYMKGILKKALAKKPDDRFASAEEFTKALLEQLMPELVKELEQSVPAQEQPQPEEGTEPVPITFKKGSGNGFDNVIGRNDLKEQLRKEVLFALQNPEKAKAYHLPPVNGILLYGPPGCGKSLVLESFAEELGFNYSIIKSADFGNIYQPGVLDNLQRIIDAATIKAPFAICIDEIEGMVPRPSKEEEPVITKESSAFLAMVNGCAQDGILVVATSNRPDMVDPLIMRVGCIDRVFFVPQPDKEARKDLFKAHLKDRPCDAIDYDELAEMSADFNAGDIAETVNEAAMTAAYMDVPISQKILVDVLRFKNPTYSTKTKIGFNK